MPIMGYSADATMKKDKKPLYWIDTMEPEIHYPGPGKSRMGMELVPVYEDGKQKENKKD